MQAKATGIKTQFDSRKWIATRVHVNATDPRRQHADRVEETGALFSRIFRHMGMRQFPLYVQPPMAREWLDPSNIVCTRHLGHRQWELLPQGDGCHKRPWKCFRRWWEETWVAFILVGCARARLTSLGYLGSYYIR